MSSITFVSKLQGKLCSQNQSPRSFAVDVSGYGNPPFSLLSPYTYSKRFFLPVPGLEDVYSHSVEGVWQGLKIIQGTIEEKLFTSKPKKRKGIVDGHQYGNEVLDLITAREKIYIPTYFFYLENYAPQAALSKIFSEQRMGKKVYVYDCDDNGDIRDPRPLSHASVLACWLNLKLFGFVFQPSNASEEKLSQILSEPSSLEEKLHTLKNELHTEEMRQAIRFHCIEHPSSIDAYHLGVFFDF